MIPIQKFYPPRFVAMLLAGLSMAAILYSSTQSSPKVAGVNQSFVDHVLDFAHFPVYSFLTLLLFLTFRSFEFRFQAITFLMAAFFGIFNEFVQLNTPGRSFSVKDMIVNALGSLFMLAFLNFCNKKSS
ncbi:MAG: VanZ family protein [Candidatus Omnitrophica bacterium]|nr:VanZ family protein [Candidatus Omnitrophota bacterium]